MTPEQEELVRNLKLPQRFNNIYALHKACVAAAELIEELTAKAEEAKKPAPKKRATKS